MNAQDIYNGITEIDDRHLLDALEHPHRKKHTVLWLSAAACLLLVCASAFFLPRLNPIAPPVPSSHPEISVIPRWEEQPLHRQYGNFTWSGEEYYVVEPVEDTLVGKPLDETTASGYDVYSDKVYTIPCTIYALNGISPAAGVALQYEGHEVYYTSRASLYTSDTLGDLIDDLGLRQHLTFGLVYDESLQPVGAASYRLDDSAAVWELLLSDRSLKNEGSEHYGMDLMGFSVNVDVLGIHNLSLSVNEDGYLQTNLISTGASYYIGKERVQAFVDYVLTHGEAVAWPEEPPAPAATQEAQSDPADSKPSIPPATPG